jgi:hypothetical protein
MDGVAPNPVRNTPCATRKPRRLSKKLPQRVREYTHVFGAVCPRDGRLATLILPDANTEAISRFLAEVCVVMRENTS